MAPARKQPKTGKLWLHPKVRRLSLDQQGPFVMLSPRMLLTVDDRRALLSRDTGKTWRPRPLFQYGRGDKEYKLSSERILLRTRAGAIVLAFNNLNEKVWLWRGELKDALPGTRLPTYVMRSCDDGRSWQDVTMLHEDWTGELRNGIETRTGRIILSSMKLLHSPGRHGVLTYCSDDEGATWIASNLIDLGGCGHHGGVTEGTIEELADGRIWMLLRTNWGFFWQAFSRDGGLSWREIGPTDIPASSAPGLLNRLASGRLILVWNRPYPEGKTSWPMTGGDGQWSEVPVSNHREEVSIAFSDDEGATFSRPVVIARQKNSWLSYPRLLECRPGDLWLTTMQGGLRLAFHETDFI